MRGVVRRNSPQEYDFNINKHLELHWGVNREEKFDVWFHSPALYSRKEPFNIKLIQRP